MAKIETIPRFTYRCDTEIKVGGFLVVGFAVPSIFRIEKLLGGTRVKVTRYNSATKKFSDNSDEMSMIMFSHYYETVEEALIDQI